MLVCEIVLSPAIGGAAVPEEILLGSLVELCLMAPELTDEQRRWYAKLDPDTRTKILLAARAAALRIEFEVGHIESLAA